MIHDHDIMQWTCVNTSLLDGTHLNAKADDLHTQLKSERTALNGYKYR